MKCHCKNVDFGTNANTVLMKPTFPLYNILGEKKDIDYVFIDTCIATEIGYLWHQGIITVNSCCGHQKVEPTVIVDKESAEKMKELGYKNAVGNYARPNETFSLIIS